MDSLQEKYVLCSQFNWSINIFKCVANVYPLPKNIPNDTKSRAIYEHIMHIFIGSILYCT